MRSYPWKTSKLHLQRLKLFPLTTPENPPPLLVGHGLVPRVRSGRPWSNRGVCISPPLPPPSSANSSIVFCRQQITFRHVCSIRSLPSPRHPLPRFFPQNPRESFSFFISILLAVFYAFGYNCIRPTIRFLLKSYSLSLEMDLEIEIFRISFWKLFLFERYSETNERIFSEFSSNFV